MFDLFTKHPKSTNQTYLQHTLFALGISIRLLRSSCIFLIHGILPFTKIPELLNLESTASYLLEKNNELDDLL